MERKSTKLEELNESVDFPDNTVEADELDGVQDKSDNDFEPGTSAFKKSTVVSNAEKPTVVTRSSRDPIAQSPENQKEFPDVQA